MSDIAGASLDAEYARRKQAREERVRTNHPKIGGLLLKISSEPASTTAFATGAAGERRTAAELTKRCDDDVRFLHNRKPGHRVRGDIDHIAISSSGVWIIDTKHYRDAKVEVRRTGGLFNERREQLFVAGRDKTAMVAGVAKQILAVRTALGSLGLDIKVRGVLCFVGANLPLFGSLEIQGVPVTGVKTTAKLINAAGELSVETINTVHAKLAGSLPPA